MTERTPLVSCTTRTVPRGGIDDVPLARARMTNIDKAKQLETVGTRETSGGDARRQMTMYPGDG